MVRIVRLTPQQWAQKEPMTDQLLAVVADNIAAARPAAAANCCRPRRRQCGFTLLELALVILLLGIMAVAVVPNLASSDPARLDVAAVEIANAWRFARAESIRLGEPRGVRNGISNARIFVLRPDFSSAPPDLIYDVYHPTSKKLYDIDLNALPFAAFDDVTRSASFRGTCNNLNRFYFDSTGAPWCLDPATVLLETYAVTLTKGNQTRVVTLDGLTGRVTIQ